MKLAVISLLVASTSAFAPAHNAARSSTAMHAKSASPLAGEIGAQAPLGFWDPFDITGGDKEVFDELRYIELKHGRVAMLAIVGQLVTRAGVRFPGYEDVPTGWAALKELPTSAWLWMGFTIAILEIMMRDATGESEFKGDFRNGFDFGWDKQTDEWKRKKRSIELNNGRAAQMGILALMVHDYMGNLGDLNPALVQ